MGVLRERLRAAFAPPAYLAPPLSGIDISTSSIKAVRLVEGPHGLTLAGYSRIRLPAGAYADGEIAERAEVVKVLKEAADEAGIRNVIGALPEPKSYLFETSASGRNREEWRVAVEQHLDEIIPLPVANTAFDLLNIGTAKNGDTLLAGVGLATRIVSDTLACFDEAGLQVSALEGETFAMARALLPTGDTSTTMLIDVGKTTTKLAIVAKRIPLFATTIAIGGHALTLAVQKHFGVTEDEARKVKAERGIVPAPGNEDYIAAMLSTVSAIRDEIARRFEYWQSRAPLSGTHEPVTQVILAGGNASVRGLPEYLEAAFRIPVHTGDVFMNLAPRKYWLPPLEYNESLAFATAIGLALYGRPTMYA